VKIVKDFDLDDVFLFSEIMDKMEIDFDSKKLTRNITTSKLEGKDDAQQIGKEFMLTFGADLIVKIIRNLYKADKQVKKFIGNMTGMQSGTVGKMGLKDIKEFFKELVAHEGFADFLSQAESSEE